MNRFQKVGFAMVFASGMVFAAGSPWWTANAPYGQVAFPWVVACQDDDSKFDPEQADNECYKTLGGWWFGYVSGPAAGKGNPNGCRVDMANQQPSTSTTDNYVKAKINGDWVSFLGPDDPSCQGPAVTNKANGDSYLLDGYLDLNIAVGDGINGVDDVYDPSIASVAVNFSTPPGGDKGSEIPVFVKKDMSQYDGFCLKYQSDHLATDKLLAELGWDETDGKGSSDFKYDGWWAKIPPAATPTIKDFKWSTTCTGGAARYEQKDCGDFSQENWSAAPLPITKAITEMMSFKITLKSYTKAAINFKLYAFGPAGTCDGTLGGGEPNPIISAKVPNVNFALNGRILSANVAKPAMVQIYNLQGAIVKSQTLSPNSNTMNLSNLPTGIYMVRSPSLGYTSRIVVK